MNKQLKMFSLAAMMMCGMILSVAAETIFDGPIPPGSDLFVLQRGAELTSSGDVDADCSNLKGEWHEILSSNPDKLRLCKGTICKVSYDCTVRQTNDEKAQFYHMFKSGADSSSQQAVSFWTAPPNVKKHHEFSAKLISDRSRIIIGIRNGGAVRISNLKIEMFTESAKTLLERPIPGDQRFRLQCGATVKDGAIDVMTKGKQKWNEYLITSPEKVPFEAGKRYRIDYDYTIGSVQPNTSFYQLLKSGNSGAKEIGWESWTGSAGEKGHKKLITTINASGYRFILGVCFNGAIRIENLKIEELK